YLRFRLYRGGGQGRCLRGRGAGHGQQGGKRIATVALGYADGWPRALSSAGHAFVAGVRVPVLGRVSMDMTALDVSAVPLESITAKTRVEFIGPQQSVDDVARACGTIGYEIYTGLGPRIKRLYRA
ncbi:MAG: hypothetical protein EBX37_13875, partial [Alphaproteobacteria bacterium]|nr:hypothetical protein [Alphaproteobacteria bacterium]